MYNTTDVLRLKFGGSFYHEAGLLPLAVCYDE